MRRLLPLAVLGLLAGCGRGGSDPEPQSGPAPSATTATAEAGRPVETPHLALTADGYGPVTIGMSEAEARRALGPDVRDDLQNGLSAGEGPDACHFLWVGEELGDVVYMIEDQRISRITVTNKGGVKTDKGLGLGATEAAVRAAYGDKLEVEPHHYINAPAKYLTAWTIPDQRGVRYETDAEGLVSEIHAGGPSIRYIEGCA